jgi:uncharacterized membrane protein YccC
MLPSWRDWIFSAKTFAGAMLALWIALRMGLDRPYWAMATAYIVAQPLTGAMRSKAVYRFCGTLLGAVATLVFIPNLVDAPVLLIAALSLWVGGCIYFAVLDRTPRSYVFLLAGYSVALIGFPIVDAPDTVWDVVLARVEEITLGIACTTVIGSIVFPIPLGPALTARLDNWIRDAAEWTRGVLSGAPDDASNAAARRRVAGDAVEIGMLATHLAYDTSNLQIATVPVAILHQRILVTLPVVSGAADRIRVLREFGGITPRLRAVLDRINQWIQSGRGAELSEAAATHADLDVLEPKIDTTSDWKTVVLAGLPSSAFVHWRQIRERFQSSDCGHPGCRSNRRGRPPGSLSVERRRGRDRSRGGFSQTTRVRTCHAGKVQRGWRAGARTRPHLGPAHLPGFVQEGAIIDLRPCDRRQELIARTPADGMPYITSFI